jgi:CheY-like chemotaxis protein/HPt (histidine-containing phosphotransfer) domain-containing protein
VVSNGRETLDALARQTFDVVLMDVQMPEMDGLQATVAIRDREKGSGGHIPIIAMTAYALKGDCERCLAAGMDGYVAKPARATDLVRAIEAAVPALPESGGPAPAEGFDWKEALAAVAGDRQLLAELAELFLGECPGWMREIETAISAGDPVRLRSAAHTLKGGLGPFAAHAAFDAAFRLETMGRKGDLTGAAEALAVLTGEVVRLQPALAALMRGMKKE